MVVHDARVDITEDFVFVLVQLPADVIVRGEEREVDIDDELPAFEQLIDERGVDGVDASFARIVFVIEIVAGRFALLLIISIETFAAAVVIVDRRVRLFDRRVVVLRQASGRHVDFNRVDVGEFVARGVNAIRREVGIGRHDSTFVLSNKFFSVMRADLLERAGLLALANL